jgi:hypothetical protein
VERHAGVLGGRAADPHEVAADRVRGGDVWDIRAFWGEFFLVVLWRLDEMWNC